MTVSTPAGAPQSPCIKVCVLDTGRVCIGCGRSIDEIVEWPAAADDRKRRILELAAQRRRARASTDEPR